jgi:uncharacterized membrane protein YcaP (DUF421 family)
MEIVVRATIIFFFLFLLIRGLGRRELAQLSPFELVVLVTMGDLVQQGVTQDDTSISGAVLAAGTIALWAFALSYAGFKSERLRNALGGVPIVVARDGHILEGVANIERLTPEDILEEARGRGIADVADIALAILEPDGNFSFITRSRNQPSSEGRRTT